MRLQRQRAAAGEGIVECGQLVAVEQLAGARVVGVLRAGVAPALPDFVARLLEHRLVGGVLPQHELPDDLEQPLPLDVGYAFVERGLRPGVGRRLLPRAGRLPIRGPALVPGVAPLGELPGGRALLGRIAEQKLGVLGRVIHHLAENHRPRRGQRPSRPPEVQGGRVAVADGFLSRRGDVDGVEGQGDFDEFFAVGGHASFLAQDAVGGTGFDLHGEPVRIEGESGWGILVDFERLACAQHPLSKTICIPQDANSLSNDRIAIADGVREILWRRLAIKPAWVVDLDVIGEPVETHGRVRLIIAMHDGVDKKFTHSNLGVVANHRLTQRAHRHGILAQVDIHQEVEGLQDRVQIPHRPLFINHVTAHITAGIPHELNVSPRQVVGRLIRQEQDTRMGGTILLEIEQTQTGQLQLERTLVLDDHLLGHGASQIGKIEAFLGEIGQRALQARQGIERPGVRNAPLTENTLLLLAGGCATRANANPDFAFVAHRGQVRRQNFDHRQIATRQGVSAHCDGRERLDVPVGAQRGEVLKQIIGDRKTAGAPVVACANDEVSGLAMIGEIIREGADACPNLSVLLTDTVRSTRSDSSSDNMVWSCSWLSIWIASWLELYLGASAHAPAARRNRNSRSSLPIIFNKTILSEHCYNIA